MLRTRTCRFKKTYWSQEEVMQNLNEHYPIGTVRPCFVDQRAPQDVYSE